MKVVEKAFELQPVIERTGRFVRECRCFPDLDADRESILAMVQQVEQLHANLGTPLRILLVGGTGVGKSSLLNAIAGAEIAAVSHRRPTTQRLTAYYHRETGTAALGALERDAILRPHDREALREKIIVDAPDFDSSVIENHDNLFKALEVADLVVCLVTPEKYMSRELFRVLRRYRHGRRFVHVMNKIDLGFDPEILDDFRRALAEEELHSDRVFRLSARAAFEDVRGGVAARAEAGEFPALVDLIERELDRVRIREIKSHNLVERVERLLDRVGRCVPADARERLEAWQSTARASFRDLAREVSGRFGEALFQTPELRNIAASLFGTSFTFVFGVFIRIAQGLRLAARTGTARASAIDVEDVKTLVHDRLAKTDADAVAEQVQLNLARFVEAGTRRGFARETIARSLDGMTLDEEVRAVYRQVETEAAAHFSDAFDEILTGRPSGFEAKNFLFNVVPGAFLVWVVYQVLVKFLAGVPLGLDYLVSAAVILTVVCYLEWRLAELVIDRGVDRSFAQLAEQLHRTVELRLEERFLGGATKAFDSIRESLDELRALRESFQEVASACVEPGEPAPPGAARALPESTAVPVSAAVAERTG